MQNPENAYIPKNNASNSKSSTVIRNSVENGINKSNTYAPPMEGLAVDNESIKCPKCGKIQRNNRTLCYNCGQPFITEDK